MPRKTGFLSAFRAMGCLALLAIAHRTAPAGPLRWEHDMKVDYSSGLAPRWSGGALLFLEADLTSQPSIHSFDAEGVGSAVIVTIPEASQISVYGYSRGLDGTIAVCGHALDKQGRQPSFIALISRSGESTEILRTDPYRAHRVALAPDGTVWAVGYELTSEGDEPKDVGDKGVIRHLDRSGKQIGAFVKRSTLSSPTVVMWGYLLAARDRVGWYSGPAFGPGSQYVEVSHDGVVSRFSDPQLQAKEHVTGMAVTDSAGTFVTTYSNEGGSRFLMLDKPRGTWVPADIPVGPQTGPPERLFGGHGDTLVFAGAEPHRYSLYTVAR